MPMCHAAFMMAESLYVTVCVYYPSVVSVSVAFLFGWLVWLLFFGGGFFVCFFVLFSPCNVCDSMVSSMQYIQLLDQLLQ